MTITEATRHALHDRLRVVLGEEEAITMMEMLPPVGWADVATRRDLDHHDAMLRADLRLQMGGLRTELRQEMADLRTELRQEMADLGTELRQEMADLGTELRQEMAKLGEQVHVEMRSGLRWCVGANVSIAGLLFAAIRLL